MPVRSGGWRGGYRFRAGGRGKATLPSPSPMTCPQVWRSGKSSTKFTPSAARCVARPVMISAVFDPNVFVSAFLTRHCATPRAVPADPDDDKIVACAVAADAAYSIVRDLHLLSLGILCSYENPNFRVTGVDSVSVGTGPSHFGSFQTPRRPPGSPPVSHARSPPRPPVSHWHDRLPWCQSAFVEQTTVFNLG